jgi:hypothetical protein
MIASVGAALEAPVTVAVAGAGTADLRSWTFHVEGVCSNLFHRLSAEVYIQ